MTQTANSANDVTRMSEGNGKISISWDELKTRQVEQRVGAMTAMKRNRDYAQLTDAPEAPAAAPIKNLFYNTVVYMSFFGVVGGLLVSLRNGVVNAL